MNLPERILQSSILRGFAVIISILAALFKLAGGAFPSQVQSLAVIFLLLAGAYLLAAALYQWRGDIKQRRKNEEEWRAEIARKLERLEHVGQPRAEVEERRDAINSEDQDKKMYMWLVRRYGLGYELMDVECEITTDGVNVRRRLLARAHAGVQQIDNTLFLKPDQQSPKSILRPPRITSLDPNRAFYIETPKETPGIVVVTISPPLRELESTEFVLSEEIKGQFYASTISRSELQRRTKEDDEDFFAWRIDRPTRKLSLKVTFPEDIRPMSYSHRVFFAPVAQGLPNREQHEELRRINTPVLGTSPRGQPQLVLSVDYPAVGLLYAIYWNPPLDESIQ
jgi:hypothetical protein